MFICFSIHLKITPESCYFASTLSLYLNFHWLRSSIFIHGVQFFYFLMHLKQGIVPNSLLRNCFPFINGLHFCDLHKEDCKTYRLISGIFYQGIFFQGIFYKAISRWARSRKLSLKQNQKSQQFLQCCLLSKFK